MDASKKRQRKDDTGAPPLRELITGVVTGLMVRGAMLGMAWVRRADAWLSDAYVRAIHGPTVSAGSSVPVLLRTMWLDLRNDRLWVQAEHGVHARRGISPAYCSDLTADVLHFFVRTVLDVLSHVRAKRVASACGGKMVVRSSCPPPDVVERDRGTFYEVQEYWSPVASRHGRQHEKKFSVRQGDKVRRDAAGPLRRPSPSSLSLSSSSSLHLSSPSYIGVLRAPAHGMSADVSDCINAFSPSLDEMDLADVLFLSKALGVMSSVASSTYTRMMLLAWPLACTVTSLDTFDDITFTTMRATRSSSSSSGRLHPLPRDTLPSVTPSPP